MTTDKVTKGAMIASTVEYSNKDDEMRKYDISCTVSLDKLGINSYNRGVVKRRNESTTVCNFNGGSDYHNIGFFGLSKDETTKVQNAVLDFIAAIEEYISDGE